MVAATVVTLAEIDQLAANARGTGEASQLAELLGHLPVMIVIGQETSLIPQSVLGTEFERKLPRAPALDRGFQVCASRTADRGAAAIVSPDRAPAPPRTPAGKPGFST